MAEKKHVKDYYGKRLDKSDDLKVTTVTQCTRKTVKLPPFIREALRLVHQEIAEREYGCATAYPEVLENMHILDLGSGCGRDCFVLSKVVGEEGKVVGLDMTDELLKLARSKIDYHTQTYGYKKPNVEFVKGYMEKMGEAGMQEGFFDIIVSNCVISLCRDKKAVLSEALKLLKVGGELYFSDLYRNGQLPPEVMDDEVMWCEGLIGSLTYKDLHQIAAEIGFTAPRLVRADNLPVVDEDIKKRLGIVTYASVTYRLFKKPSGESAPGPATPAEVTYKGGIRGSEENLEFDNLLTFQKGTPKKVSAEIHAILTSSRFGPYFECVPDEGVGDVADQVVDPFELTNQEMKNPCRG